MTIAAASMMLPSTALAALMAGAVATDLRSRRIPNKLVLVGLGIALALHALALAGVGTPLAGLGWWAPLAGIGIGFIALMPLHRIRACGAGDVKLMAMVGAFVGPTTVLHATLATLVAGGVLSLVFMLGRGVAARTVENLRGMVAVWTLNLTSRQGVALPPPLQATAARLPYAVAIAAGTAIALAWRVSGAGG